MGQVQRYPADLFTDSVERLFKAVRDIALPVLRQIDGPWVDRLIAMNRLSHSKLASPYSDSDVGNAVHSGALPENWQRALESTHDLFTTAQYFELVCTQINDFKSEHGDHELDGLHMDFLGVSWHVWAYALLEKTKNTIMRRVILGESNDLRKAREGIEQEFRDLLGVQLAKMKAVRDPTLHIIGQARFSKTELRSASRAITGDKMWESVVALGVPAGDSIREAHRWTGEQRIEYRRHAIRSMTEVLAGLYLKFVDASAEILLRPSS